MNSQLVLPGVSGARRTVRYKPSVSQNLALGCVLLASFFAVPQTQANASWWNTAWNAAKCALGTAGGAGLGFISGAAVGTVSLPVFGTVAGSTVGAWSGAAVGAAASC
jgi:hypothetical protein